MNWIYQGYLAEAPSLQRHVDYLTSAFAKARYWLQAAPFCVPVVRADGRLSRAKVPQPNETAEVVAGP